eukprot:46582-Pyramimonas_sp.AAC.1
MSRGAAGGVAEVPARGHAQGTLNEEYCDGLRQRLSDLVRAERGGEAPPDVDGQERGTVASAGDTGEAHQIRRM